MRSAEWASRQRPIPHSEFRIPHWQKLRGVESNHRPPGSEPGVTTSSNCPGRVMTFSSSFLSSSTPSRAVVEYEDDDEDEHDDPTMERASFSSGRGSRTPIAWFKAKQRTVGPSPLLAGGSRLNGAAARSLKVPCGSRTRVAGLEDRRLCRSAKSTCRLPCTRPRRRPRKKNRERRRRRGRGQQGQTSGRRGSRTLKAR